MILISLQFILAQGFQASLDWKITKKSRVRQVITNVGTLLGHPLELNYPGLIRCEFPPGSGEEHHGEGGIWIGAITPDNDTLVTTTVSWSTPPYWETYPSDADWDTIWVVNKGEVVDIPYWPNYKGVSDQDFVMRYNDYGPLSLKDERHKPLYLEFIQTTYSYSSPKSLSEILIHQYYVTPVKFDLKKVFVGIWLDPNVGVIENGANWFDDYSWFEPNLKLAVGADNPGGTDGDAISPIGVMPILPKTVDLRRIVWSWTWGNTALAPGMVPPTDLEKYRQLLTPGVIMQNQLTPSGSHFVLSFGPFDLTVGDTLKFGVAEILGEGLEGVVSNARAVKLLIEKDFAVPSPPPAPPLRVETDNHKVRLIWEPTDEVNPETYKDSARGDGAEQPFEGYRVYKSTVSLQGPWTLIAEYDIEGNEFGNNLGLKHEYTEELLLNNFEYYYSVTAFSKPDLMLNWPSLESSIEANAVTVTPGPAPPETVGEVAVVPNPYRGDIDYNKFNPPWERPGGSRTRWMEQDRRIQFINLPKKCEIKIYTLSGELITTIQHDDPFKGYEDWNLTSSVGQAVASDIYLFSVRDLITGKTQVGKFVIIK